MTSTVLDVGLFLLCVSASVGTIVGVVPTATDPDPSVDDLADRIATETATVQYTTAKDEDRRHHATLAEHLTLAARVDAGASHSERTYRAAVSQAVDRRLDPRTAVTVRTPTTGDANGSAFRTEIAVGGDPPSTARVWTAIVSVPLGQGDATARLVVRRWDRATV